MKFSAIGGTIIKDFRTTVIFSRFSRGEEISPAFSAFKESLRKGSPMADIFELFKKISSGDNSTRTPVTHLVVGLGNPGVKYSRTRHNAGFLAVDYLAQKLSLGTFRLKFKSTCAEGTVDGHRVLFMKPETFMNNSGEAVLEASGFYKIPPENILVISDDINLAPGTIRIRESGSAGGQKGLESIITCLGSDKFPRIRIGVGQKPSPDYELADWVLGQIPEEDFEAIFETFTRVEGALPFILDKKTADAMARFNGKGKAPDVKKQVKDE